MAKVVVDTQGVVAPRWWDWGKVLVIGAGAGIAWWGAWILLRQHILDVPSSAGGVAHIFIAVLATLVLIRCAVPRPLLVSLASVVLLWSLGGAIAGLHWPEALLWSVGLFVASYGLFSLVSRIRTLWVAIITAVIIVVAATIILAL